MFTTYLPNRCDGCGDKFSTAHGLEYRKGRLAIQRHGEIKLELPDLATRALIPSATNPGRSADVEESEGMSTPTEERGDLQIRKLWKHHTDCISGRAYYDQHSKLSLLKLLAWYQK